MTTFIDESGRVYKSVEPCHWGMVEVEPEPVTALLPRRRRREFEFYTFGTPAQRKPVDVLA